MSLGDGDSLIPASFGIDVDGVVIKQITEVSGLKMEQDVIQLKQNTADGKYVIKNMPGRYKAGECTVTCPHNGAGTFEKWIKDSRFGKVGDIRKGCSIILYDFEGKEIKRYNLLNAWPKSLEISALKAGDTNPATEKLVITYEQIEIG